MKILIIDKQPHNELGDALKNYNIVLEHKTELGKNMDSTGYGLVILCASGREQLLKALENKNLPDFNPVVISDYIDDRFITLCIKLGCKDIIRKPYNPEAAAQRLNCLIESIPAGESGSIVPVSNNSVCWSIEDYIKTEIKRANRGKTPLAFLLAGFLKNQVSKEDIKTVVDTFRTCLRDTDMAEYYKDFILVMLPYCGKVQIGAIRSKLEKSSAGYELYFYSTIKEKYYDTPMKNEMEIIFDAMEEEFRKGLGNAKNSITKYF